jgi:hypothetical protein
LWFFTPRESYRLMEQDLTDFVNCAEEYAIMSIFNKDYDEKAAEACQCLSIIRPELMVPLIIEKSDVFLRSFYSISCSLCRHFLSIDSMTEPHRFISIMNFLKHVARLIVQQTSS